MTLPNGELCKQVTVFEDVATVSNHVKPTVTVTAVCHAFAGVDAKGSDITKSPVTVGGTVTVFVHSKETIGGDNSDVPEHSSPSKSGNNSAPSAPSASNLSDSSPVPGS